MKANERAKVVQALRTMPTYYPNEYPDCLFIDLLAQAIGAEGVDYIVCGRHETPTACYPEIVKRLIELIDPELQEEA